MKTETFRRNKKKKEKNTQIQRTLFPDTLSDKLAQITLKFVTPYLFLSLSFLFLLCKIPFKKTSLPVLSF